MTAMRKKKNRRRLSKADQTKALILETALEMFRERGYDDTTMRAIAQKAGVSLGNAYYYFRSKEYLIHILSTPPRQSCRRRTTGARKRENTKSTPADRDANKDRHDETVSPVFGRAFKDCRRAAESIESVWRRY